MSAYTRRQALHLAAAPLVAAGFAPLTRAASRADRFTFLAVNDLHSFSDECVPFFKNVVTKMRESAPQAAFCLIAGDVADGGTAEQLFAVRETFGALGIPIHPVPGNHDCLTDTDRTGYDAVFPGKLNYTFTHGGWQFLGLDSTQGTEFDDTVISTTTLEWLDAALPKLDPAAPSVAFTHFPLGERVPYRPRNADDLLGKLTKLNLRATFSGHWHGLNEQRRGATELIVNRCCARIRGNRDGSPLKGWWVCDASPDGSLAHRFVALPQPAEALR